MTAPPLLVTSLSCLAGKTVYLDISNGDPAKPLIKFIRKHLQKQGAIVDDFFSRSVHYVFTDRNCNDDAKGSSTSGESSSAMPASALPSVQSYAGNNPVITKALSWGIGVYRLSTIESWLRRNLRNLGLSSSAGPASGDLISPTATTSAASTANSSFRPPAGLPLGGDSKKPPRFSSSSRVIPKALVNNNKPKAEKPPIRLSGAFIRLDFVSGESRPFYHEMSTWPSLRFEPLSRSVSAGGSPFVDASPAVTIQPAPRLGGSGAANKIKPAAMRGYCEACCMVVADIDRHLAGDEHARRIRKAATATTSTQQNRSSRQSAAAAAGSSKTKGRTSFGEDDDNFVKPLATLDSVISQHFGSTPVMRMALLESYLEQAAGEYLLYGFDNNTSAMFSDDGSDVPVKRARPGADKDEENDVNESISVSEHDTAVKQPEKEEQKGEMPNDCRLAVAVDKMEQHFNEEVDVPVNCTLVPATAPTADRVHSPSKVIELPKEMSTIPAPVPLPPIPVSMPSHSAVMAMEVTTATTAAEDTSLCLATAFARTSAIIPLQKNCKEHVAEKETKAKSSTSSSTVIVKNFPAPSCALALAETIERLKTISSEPLAPPPVSVSANGELVNNISPASPIIQSRKTRRLLPKTTAMIADVVSVPPAMPPPKRQQPIVANIPVYHCQEKLQVAAKSVASSLPSADVVCKYNSNIVNNTNLLTTFPAAATMLPPTTNHSTAVATETVVVLKKPSTSGGRKKSTAAKEPKETVAGKQAVAKSSSPAKRKGKSRAKAPAVQVSENVHSSGVLHSQAQTQANGYQFYDNTPSENNEPQPIAACTLTESVLNLSLRNCAARSATMAASVQPLKLVEIAPKTSTAVVDHQQPSNDGGGSCAITWSAFVQPTAYVFQNNNLTATSSYQGVFNFQAHAIQQQSRQQPLPPVQSLRPHAATAPASSSSSSNSSFFVSNSTNSYNHQQHHYSAVNQR